ncbi:hypothetical protein F4861DRAFT_544039 [Xylaria intraflava]|nr:hypothetical protein F4861DRAFT_544039 [Xylaria intraflava]
MRRANFLLGLLGVVGACARDTGRHDSSLVQSAPSLIAGDGPKPAEAFPRPPLTQRGPRDTYPINCHLHNWPSASVDSIKQAYSWFYQILTPLEADAQHCRRIACYGVSAVWLCADSLGYKSPNSMSIADKMNDLLDGDHGCLDPGNKDMVQGQAFTSDGWNVLVRGGEDCSVEAPEQPIFY